MDTELTTPQRWQVVAPELQERHLLGDENNNGFDVEKSLFSTGINFDIWGTLARPVIPVAQPREDVSREGDEEDDEDYYPWRMSLGMLDLLSNELVDIIVDFVDDSDLVALGLTCRGFWSLVVPQVQSRYIKRAAPWAGKKIALQGSHSTILPQSFEEKGLAKKMVDEFAWRVEQHLARNFFCCMEFEGRAPETDVTREAVFLNSFEKDFSGSMIPKWRRKEMRQQLKSPDLFPSDRDWVLRNLTTHEYVSATIWWGCIRISKIKLVDALLTQILWSTYREPRQMVWKDRYKGAWAGHCFDVVTKEVMMSEGGTEKWKDATEKVRQGGRTFGYHAYARV